LFTAPHVFIRTVWRASNLLLALSILVTIYAAAWEYSVSKYLDGFSDAIVSATASPEQKVEAILDWMRSGPPRAVASDPSDLPTRDPVTTLNYQQLLNVCGTATNAFLNLARSSDLKVQRLLLLTPGHSTKHVVAEVFINGRWVIVDLSYRIAMRDGQGRLLTRKDLQNPLIFAQATAAIPNYPQEYSYDHFTHVRIGRIPFVGFGLRRLLDSSYPGWDEAFDWSLLLERESFFVLFCSALTTVILLLWRVVLAWYADRRLRIPRFRLREHFFRAWTEFFNVTPR
jgi:hypothetical protein